MYMLVLCVRSAPSQTVRPVLRGDTSILHLRFSYRKFNTFLKIHAPGFRLDPQRPVCRYQIFREEPTEPEFLSIEGLNRIYECEPGCKRLEVVRDMFLMSAFTGLAFSDVSQLTSEHIVRDNTGNLWIRKHRQKTRQISNIPLLDIPAAILKKYEGDKKAAKKGVLLPVPANQVMNRYLKEIATICKIDKYLTTHVARHTYATVCLSQGVSLKNVSKMLGHASVKMTEHYARVLDTSILREMTEIRDAMNFGILSQQSKAAEG